MNLLFFLWQHDHYMNDDRQVHELSYLYTSSLFEIRARSQALMSTCRTFLKSDRVRIDWANQLDEYRAAFEILDRSRDGSIDKVELENVLGRFTADGCREWACACTVCTAWREKVSVVEVDWKAFGEKFEQLDDDGSGSLEFRGCSLQASLLCDASLSDGWRS